MKYLLDLTTLLIFLEGKKQSGEVSAELKRLSGNAKGPYRARIALSEGMVVSCVIQDREGRIFIGGENALRELKQTMHNEWEWAPAPPPTLAPRVSAPAELPERNRRMPKDVTMLIPRLIFPLESMDKNALPRRHWQVLLLINGSRTIAQIAYMLTSSPSPADLQKLIDILKDLQERGFVLVRTD